MNLKNKILPKKIPIFFSLFVCINCFSQTEGKSLKISKITEAITIDGELNETVWQNAEKAAAFCQNFPYE